MVLCEAPGNLVLSIGEVLAGSQSSGFTLRDTSHSKTFFFFVNSETVNAHKAVSFLAGARFQPSLSATANGQ